MLNNARNINMKYRVIMLVLICVCGFVYVRCLVSLGLPGVLGPAWCAGPIVSWLYNRPTVSFNSFAQVRIHCNIKGGPCRPPRTFLRIRPWTDGSPVASGTPVPKHQQALLQKMPKLTLKKLRSADGVALAASVASLQYKETHEQSAYSL